MRNSAREAALNIIFAQQFNSDCMDALKKKIYKQFGLEKDEDLLFANEMVRIIFITSLRNAFLSSTDDKA